jgi:hypothetical protein
VLYEEATKIVKYVGRTSNSEARMRSHNKNPEKGRLQYRSVSRGLKYSEARGLEQRLYDHFRNLNKLLNRIKPVGEKKCKSISL